MSKRKILLILAAAVLFAVLSLSCAYAAETYYETVKADVPIWSSYSSDSTQIVRIGSSGYVLRVTDSVTNSSDNLWYQIGSGSYGGYSLSGRWVYSGNVKKHTHDYSSNGGVCRASGCGYTYSYSVSGLSGLYQVTNSDGCKVWSIPYSTGSSVHKRTIGYGTVCAVNGKTTNAEGNVWYRLTDGNWIYSGNVKSHTHDYDGNGGVCKTPGCGYGFPLNITNMSQVYEVTNTDGCWVWSIPYSTGSAVHQRTIGYRYVCSVNGKATNADGNLWYRLTDGNWIYSGNVKVHSHDFTGNGGECNSPGCGTCFSLTIVKYDNHYYQVKNTDGSAIWSAPYSTGSSVKKRTIPYGCVIKVDAYTNNADDHLWFRLTDGTWIYGGNLESHTHDCVGNGGVCKGLGCGYEYPLSITDLNSTYVVTASEGAAIWSIPYSTGKAVKSRTAAVNTVLSVNGRAKNADGNLWYRLSDGTWVYSENVTQRFSVYFNVNGGSGAPGTQYCLAGKKLTISSTKPVRSQYIFKGWGTSSGDTSVDYKPGTSYSFNGNVTLYAIWEKCSHPDYEGGYCLECGWEYPLTIESLSGTFVVTNTEGAGIWARPYSYRTTLVRKAAVNTVLTINAKTTNQAGNLWYRLTDGNWIYSGNVTQRFTVSYNANGGTGAPAAQTCLKGKTLTLSNVTPRRVGYLFKQWITTPSLTNLSIVYKPGAKVTVNGNKTMYAMWEECPHSRYTGGICDACGYEYPLTITSMTATFMVKNTDGAKIWSRPYSDNSTLITTAAYDTVLNINAKTANKAGNTWYRLTNGNWVYSGNIVRCYRVSYVLNGGTNNSTNPQYYKVTEAVTLKKATRTGYTFDSWYRESVFNNPISKITKGSSGDVTLYARWIPHTYYIAFDGNGADSGSMANMTARYDAASALPVNQFSRTYYTFAGWNTKSGGAGTFYADGTTVRNLSSKDGVTVTLYAQWKPVLPVITAQPKAKTVTDGNTASFSVKAEGAELTYQWYFKTPSGDWTKCTSNGYNTDTYSVEAKPGRTGYQYKCTVTNPAGSVTSSAVKLTVIYKPSVTLQPKSKTVVPGTSVTFTIKAEGGNLKYQWYYKAPGGTWKACTSDGSDTASYTVKATLTRNGYQYYCKVRNAEGTAKSDSAVLTVEKAKLLSASVVNSKLPYNGKAHTPVLTVKAKVNGKTVTLTADKDYTAKYTNNVNAGTATVTVTGKGDYTGKVTATFVINRVKLTSAALSKTSMAYTGKALKPGVTVKARVDGAYVVLTKGTDYTVKYENNVEKGTATVTVTGKGNFTGTITKTFTIK